MLKLENVCFAYGSHKVLEGVDFVAERGSVTVITGANGVGKTTLMRILATLAYPSNGRILADGHDIFAEPLRYRRALGYLDEAAPIEPGLTVKQYLKYRAHFKGEQSRKIRHRVQEALESTGIVEFSDAAVTRLSVGVRRRVAFAEAVILRPRYLILDDPFAGLDVASRELMITSLSSLAGSSCVVITGHDTAIFSRLGAQLLELSDGRVH